MTVPPMRQPEDLTRMLNLTAFAPLRKTIAKALGSQIAQSIRPAMRTWVHPLPCPQCGAVCAYLWNERLHEAAGGRPGFALGTAPNTNVTLTCPGGHAVTISGQAVARNIRDGRPALPTRRGRR